jgi:cytosine/adenosine deaminase-related metal-dependent hydrolase
MLDSGVKVGLGVDGSASNDSGNMLNEARQTMLLQRVNSKASSMTAREALKVSTRGGASVLNRDDIGVLAPGYAADITAFKRNNVDFSGSDWDPVASLVFCGPGKANYTIINGKIIVNEGQLSTIPMEKLIHEHNKLSHNLINLST